MSFLVNRIDVVSRVILSKDLKVLCHVFSEKFSTSECKAVSSIWCPPLLFLFPQSSLDTLCHSCDLLLLSLSVVHFWIRALLDFIQVVDRLFNVVVHYSKHSLTRIDLLVRF